jgi:hypothetical protein
MLSTVPCEGFGQAKPAVSNALLAWLSVVIGVSLAEHPAKSKITATNEILFIVPSLLIQVSREQW